MQEKYWGKEINIFLISKKQGIVKHTKAVEVEKKGFSKRFHNV